MFILRLVLRLIRLLFFFVGPILILLVGLAVWWIAPAFGPIEPETATSSRMMLWILLRDLDKQSDDTLLRLTKRANELYGSESNPAYNVAIPPYLKGMVSSELTKRKKILSELDISAADPNAVEPDITKSRIEKNIVRLIKTWYVHKMHDFNDASVFDKTKKLDIIIADLKCWSSLYDNVYENCGLTAPTLLEKSKEGEVLFTKFRKMTDPDEFKEMVNFKEKLQAAFVYSEAGSRFQKFLKPFLNAHPL